jgi:26S proteasome regulatory subunit T4
MYHSINLDIVKSSSGTRNVVGVKAKLDRSKLIVGARVALDQTTQTIMQVLPREVDPVVFSMMNEDPGKVDFSDIGGLGDQLRILRETI